jgi:hypothetical protein
VKLPTAAQPERRSVTPEGWPIFQRRSDPAFRLFVRCLQPSNRKDPLETPAALRALATPHGEPVAFLQHHLGNGP